MTRRPSPQRARAPRPSLRRLRTATIILIAGFAAVLLAGAASHLSLQYTAAVDAALRDARTNANAIGSQGEQTFSETFRILEGIADVYAHYREHGDGEQLYLHELLASKLTRAPQVLTFVIFDENDNGVASALTYPLAPDFDRPERSLLRYQPRYVDGFYIGEIYRSIRPEFAADAWLLPVSMRVNGPDGSPLGRVTAVIDVKFFEKFYKMLDVGTHGRITLRSSNGFLVATNRAGTVGERTPETEEQPRILNSLPNRTLEIIRPWTSGEVTIRRMLGNAPFFVSVSLDARDFLASWRVLRTAVALAILGIVIVMLGFAYIIFLQLKRAEKNEADLRQAKAIAEEANDAKSRFLAHMSHEFRTPLNAIMGFSEIIKNKVLGGDVAPSYVSYADHIHRSGEHLLHIVNDILDMAKVESGAQPLQQKAIDMGEATASAISFIEGLAGQKNVRMDVEAMENLPRVTGDERFVRQVLINLLSNAVKFSPAGGKIRVAAAHSPGKSLDISVADNGPGIEPTLLRRLGEPFLQGNPAISQSGQGTGLGLSICKRYMDLLGGELIINSTVDRGTTATIRFPNSLLTDDNAH